METKIILWLEDQFEDFAPYRSALYRAGYLVEFVPSVSGAIQKLREDNYTAIVLDIKVLPGEDNEWIKLDQKIREENPDSDPYLGLLLLRSLFPDKIEDKHKKSEIIKLVPPIRINPKKIIVFSVVYTKITEIRSFGIPVDQIIYKSASDTMTLPKLVKKISEMENSK